MLMRSRFRSKDRYGSDKKQFLTWGRGMQFDVEEFSRRLQAIGESEAVVPLRRATLHALELFGVTKAYYVAPLTKDARVGRIVTNVGLPWSWERQYRARLHRIDPLPRIAMARLTAVYWPDGIADEKLSKKEVRYLEIAKRSGLGRGVAVASFGPNGRSGFLGAILDDEAPTPNGEALMRFHAIGQVSLQCYCRLVPVSETLVALSNRELEVLHWMGQGKSNSVIADILEISPSSVDVYARRIFAKLKVSDRTMAAVKALSLGLIISRDYNDMVQLASDAQQEGKSPLEDEKGG